jgi:hypothetical protein
MAVGPGSAAMDLSTTLSSAYRYNQNMMEYYTCKPSYSSLSCLLSSLNEPFINLAR